MRSLQWWIPSRQCFGCCIRTLMNSKRTCSTTLKQENLLYYTEAREPALPHWSKRTCSTTMKQENLLHHTEAREPALPHWSKRTCFTTLKQENLLYHTEAREPALPHWNKRTCSTTLKQENLLYHTEARAPALPHWSALALKREHVRKSLVAEGINDRILFPRQQSKVKRVLQEAAGWWIAFETGLDIFGRRTYWTDHCRAPLWLCGQTQKLHHETGAMGTKSWIRKTRYLWKSLFFCH